MLDPHRSRPAEGDHPVVPARPVGDHPGVWRQPGASGQDQRRVRRRHQRGWRRAHGQDRREPHGPAHRPLPLRRSRGFQGVVDTLGGVEMCPPSYLADPATGRIQDVLTGLDIEPGCQTMDGATALAFVRTRHLPCDNIPDFSRIGRQQQFLRALFTQMLRPRRSRRRPPSSRPSWRTCAATSESPAGRPGLPGRADAGLTTGAAEFRAVPGTAGWEGSLSVVHMDPRRGADLRRDPRGPADLRRRYRPRRCADIAGEHPRGGDRRQLGRDGHRRPDRPRERGVRRVAGDLGGGHGSRRA